MSRVRQQVDIDELVAIFVDLNGIDRAAEEKLQGLSAEQQREVLAPFIYMQNVRNSSVALRSRISNVLNGRSAMGRAVAEEEMLRRGELEKESRACSPDNA